ncbi:MULTISPECIES: hypothetical protein [unclassified Bartonella]
MLHIHALVLKKDLSTLITPILQNAARKEMVSPHEVYKILSALPYLYAYGKTRLRL